MRITGHHFSPGTTQPVWLTVHVPLYACVWWALASALEARAQESTCRPQEGLVLDAPYPRPQYLTNGRLPLCQQYECSCCNRSHALNLFRGIKAANDDETFSRRCVDFLGTMACRVCDPEVGAGLKPAICAATCSAWHAACKHDYFGFDPRSDRLVPCDDGAISSGRMLVCSKLEELASDGRQFCGMAGLTVADGPNSEDQPCFDGVARKHPELCIQPPPTPKTSSSTSGRSRSRGRGSDDRTLLDKLGGMAVVVALLAAAWVYLWRLGAVQDLWLGVTTSVRGLLGGLAAAERRVTQPRGTGGARPVQGWGGAPGRPRYAR